MLPVNRGDPFYFNLARLIDNLQNVSIDYKPVFGEGIFYVKNLIAFTLCPVNTLKFRKYNLQIKSQQKGGERGKTYLRIPASEEHIFRQKN